MTPCCGSFATWARTSDASTWACTSWTSPCRSARTTCPTHPPGGCSRQWPRASVSAHPKPPETHAHLLDIPGDPRGRLSRPGAEPGHDILPAAYGHPCCDNSGPPDESYHALRLGNLRNRIGRHRVSGDGADVAVPPEVPALVVRLEPGAHQVQHAGVQLSRAAACRVPGDR